MLLYVVNSVNDVPVLPPISSHHAKTSPYILPIRVVKLERLLHLFLNL
jgi:hypothetical protein